MTFLGTLSERSHCKLTIFANPQKSEKIILEKKKSDKLLKNQVLGGRFTKKLFHLTFHNHFVELIKEKQTKCDFSSFSILFSAFEIFAYGNHPYFRRSSKNILVNNFYWWQSNMGKLRLLNAQCFHAVNRFPCS